MTDRTFLEGCLISADPDTLALCTVVDRRALAAAVATLEASEDLLADLADVGTLADTIASGFEQDPAPHIEVSLPCPECGRTTRLRNSDTGEWICTRQACGAWGM